MNILYIAPRYHTNQTPIIKGWIENGDKVKFISQYAGKTEDYSVLTPDILGYSVFFKIINWLYTNIVNRNIKKSANIFAFEMKCGFPPIFRLNKELKLFKPDVVIMRERSIYNMVAYALCRVRGIKTILYNQTPLWNEEPIKNDIWHRIVRKCTPNIRITPVMGTKTKESKKEKNSYFIPFVAETKILLEDKNYFKNEKMNLLCVAKYETRKNLLMLLEIIDGLKRDYPIVLTMIGEVSTTHHRTYYQQIVDYVAEKNLEDNVCLLQNKSMQEVEEAYKSADAFILPSTREVASISQLEAMAYALPVICSDTNGTACYIEEGKSGFLFKDGDIISLEQQIRKMLEDKENMVRMGAYSYYLVAERYSFQDYRQRIQELI